MRIVHSLPVVLGLMSLHAVCSNAADSEDANFSKQGPCSVAQKELRFPVPKELQSLGSTLPVFFTFPSNCPQPNLLELKPPYPLLIFYNGFQLRASFYSRIAKRAASWGYVVMQYNLKLFSMPSARVETQAYAPMVEWVKAEASNKQSPLYGLVDTSRVVVAGHSRGGKLAALILGGNKDVKAGWLVDPIDASQYAPISKDNPSGAEAIRKSGKAVGVTGAGVKSSCNPPDGNYTSFYGDGAVDSWLEFIPKASHATFSDAGAVLNAAQDVLCGRGGISRATAADITATPMLAWFYKALNETSVGAGGAGADPLASFYHWVERKEAEGVLKFDVKEGKQSSSAASSRSLKEDDSVQVPAGIL